MNFILCLNNCTDLLNQLHLAHKNNFEMFVFKRISMYFGSVTKKNSFTLDDSLTSTSTNNVILHRGIKQPSQNKHTSISFDHGNEINLLYLHLHYLLSIMTNIFLLSLFFTTLLFPLMTILSRLFFKWGENLLHFLVALSDTLDKTLWPWLIIQFPYISSNKIHTLLATYFDEVIILHFYEIKAYKKATPCVDYRDESSFNTKCDFSPVCPDLARKIFKAILSCCKCISIEHDYKKLLQKLCTILSRVTLPGKLISDVPEETAAIKCTDDAPCNTIRVLSFTMPLIELANENAEAVRFEINKSPDTKKPLHCQYHNNDFNGENFEEARPEIVSSSASDEFSGAKHLITPSQPTSSDNVHLLTKVATSDSNNTKLHEKFKHIVSKCHR